MKNGNVSNRQEKIVKPVTPDFRRNIKALMSEKSISKSELVKLAYKEGLSRATVYNVLNENYKKKIREDTYDKLAAALGVSTKVLKRGNTQIDYEYLISKLKQHYTSDMAYRPIDENPDRYDPNEEAPELPIDSYLVIYCGADYKELIENNILPSNEVQTKICKEFGYKPKEIFKITGHYPIGIKSVHVKHMNVVSTEEFDDSQFDELFSELNQINKKIVFNLCKDLFIHQKYK